MKKYVYLEPQEVSLDDLVKDFIPDYDVIDESIKQKTLQIYAYNCFGSPYFSAPLHCPEGS